MKADNQKRRRFLKGSLLGLGSMAVGASVAEGGTKWTGASFLGGGNSLQLAQCSLTPSDVQGPFWANFALLRQDITEGFVGFPLTIFLQIKSASSCDPVVGAVVDIWHDDPEGRYSGFASEGTAGLTFLRGIQITDPNGFVRFDSIYPGWYPGRTPHLHVKVNPNAVQELTTQIYLDDDFSDRVYTHVPAYSARGSSPTKNSTDPFFNPDLKAKVYYDPVSRSIVAGMRIVIL